MMILLDLDGLDRDVNDIGELIDDDLDLGVHPRLHPWVVPIDVNGAGINLQIGRVTAAAGVRQDGKFGDATIQFFARLGIDAHLHWLADAHLFDLRFMHVHTHAHLAHVWDGQHGLTQTHRSPLFNGVGVVVGRAGVQITVGHQSKLGSLDHTSLQLLFQILAPVQFHFIAPFGRAKFGLGLSHAGAVGADGAQQLVQGFAIGVEIRGAQLGKLVFFEQSERRLGGLHGEFDLVKAHLVVLQQGGGHKFFLRQTLG